MRNAHCRTWNMAGKNGEYIPLSFYDVKDAPELMRNVKEVVSEEKEWEVDFSGSFFSNEKMMGELTVILFVSLLAVCSYGRPSLI